MPTSSLRTLLVAALLVVLAGACGRDRRRGGGADDGSGSGPDAGGVDASTLTAPPGELALRVDFATWGGASAAGRQLLHVGVRLGNGSGGSPASLDPALFSAQTGAGTEVMGAGDAAFGGACSADLAVAAGADRACALAFHVPTGETPTRVVYRGSDGREATASIGACSPASPGGLCAAGLSCVDGNCLALCSPESPAGVCPSPGEACRAGACVAECSAANPTGPCREGSCVDGVCSTACLTFDFGAAGCIDCLTAVSSSEVCGSLTDPACPDAEACALCPFGGGNTCTCTADPACAGCEAVATSAWDCIAAECPVCRS